ncbi:MAG TPA: NAD(P)-binding domain-containing protein [Bacteroidales bacterium]|nr:NAD(P)-binding domain-containing protein [Bacteroidales bacterium]
MKNIAILGTGMVGDVLGTKLVLLGHKVMMGSRTENNEKALAWKNKNGTLASNGTFADAAAFGEIIFNCTSGKVSLEALQLAGRENLQGKILVDVANPLDFSKGMPPTLTICNTDSLGEVIQRQFPDVRVVKALNTMNCQLMVNPGFLKEPGNVFMCGNDSGAKSEVDKLLRSFGWEKIIDLGDISAARGTEQLLPAWVRLMGKLETPMFNFSIVQ